MKKNLRQIAKSALKQQSYDMDSIYGSDKESKKMANKVLDRRNVAEDYKHQYVAEKNMKAKSNSYSKKGNDVEKKRQSNMVMEADLNDQSKGAEDYINKKYGKSGIEWYPTDFSDYKEFENAVLDVMSEGEISSRYPNNVWERAAKRYTKRVFNTEQATSPFKKLSKTTKNSVKKK